MTDLVTYEATIRATPERVFAVLLRTIGRRGRLHEVADYGTALVFSPGLPSARETRLLRACVRRTEDGTLLQIVPADPRAALADREAEHLWIGAAINDLQDHFAAHPDPCTQAQTRAPSPLQNRQRDARSGSTQSR